MLEIRKITVKIILLIADIILLAYKIIKQIKLPNKKEKGNLLSSVFIFFVSIMARINIFEHGFFTIAPAFKNRYMKQAIFFTGSLLFLLSLSEWTGDKNFIYAGKTINTEQQISNSLSAKAISSNYKAENLLNKKIQYHPEPRFNASQYTKTFYPSAVNRYLLIRNLRI